jgi:hypothetical protein
VKGGGFVAVEESGENARKGGEEGVAGVGGVVGLHKGGSESGHACCFSGDFINILGREVLRKKGERRGQRGKWGKMNN